ncbi:hypothetical protein SDC9_194971 [bioreactor metagenome]|uniref:Uncharacterized protein n=1 Tax=bioreactor metagenome TaxID=1076179 RepID=A0A645IAA2_9ZZZZ
MAGKQEILQHTEKVEIDEDRAVLQEERAMLQHFLKGSELVGQFGLQLFLAGFPLINAAAPELSLFMPQKR